MVITNMKDLLKMLIELFGIIFMFIVAGIAFMIAIFRYFFRR